MQTLPKMKICSTCKDEKLLSEFYKNRSKKDGRNDKCKICSLAYNRQYQKDNPEKMSKIKKRWRKNNIDKARKSNRECNARNPEGARAATKKYAKLNPEKKKAHNLLNYAVASGKIIKPDMCEMCETVHDHIHGHHDDYEKPLDVIWVCPSCHSTIHQEKSK